eukprot:7832535-Lingulodinium_polyedra.AAC.1
MRNGPCGRWLGAGGRLRQNLLCRDWRMLAGSPLGVPPVEITGARWLPRAPWPSVKLSRSRTRIPPRFNQRPISKPWSPSM